MRSIEHTRSVFEGLLVMALTAAVLIATASSSAARSARVHSRSRGVVHTAAPATPPAEGIPEALKQQSEMLAGVEASQSALEKETAELRTLVQRQMSQLNTQSTDSQLQTRQTLEQMNQELNSVRRWLKFVVVLFVLALAGLLYLIRQLPKTEDQPVKWKGKVPEIGTDDEGVIAWRSGETANGPGRKLDDRKEGAIPPVAK